MQEPSDKIKTVLRFNLSDKMRLGRGKIELLEHILELGSISAAGRAMDMSYRRAWLLVSEMNAMFKEDVVDSQRGGQNGGGAALTPFGADLLKRFRGMEAAAARALEPDLKWLEEHRVEGSKEPSDS